MPIKKVENRYTLPGVKWSPLLQSDQAITGLKREIRESKKALRGLTDPIYREAEQKFLSESEASLQRHREKRQKLDDRLQNQEARYAKQA
jgi:hypothetical protein